MKKIYLLLLMLIVGIGSTWADGVTSFSDFSDSKSYTLTTKRSTIYWDGSDTKVNASSSTKSNNTFLVLKSKTTNRIYLYNIGAEKFVGQSGTNGILTDNPVAYWTLKSSTTDGYPWMIDAMSGDHWNTGTDDMTINWWSYEDEGNVFKIEVSDESLDASVYSAARTAVDTWDGTASITYNYTYNSTSKGSETFTVEYGKSYPTPTSFGMKVGADYISFSGIPTDIVSPTSSTTVDVTINGTNSSFPFTTSTISDNAFDKDTKWYTMNINGKPIYYNGTNFQSDKDDASNADAYLYAFTGNIEDGYTIYNKTVGADKVLFSNAGNTTITPIATSSVTTGGAWSIAKNGDGYLFKEVGTNVADKAYMDRGAESSSWLLTFWNSDNAKANGGNRVTIASVGSISELQSQLSTTLQNLYIGTNPGEYTVASGKQTAYEGYVALTTATAANANIADLVTANAITDWTTELGLTMNALTAGKYRIINGKTAFNKTKVLTANFSGNDYVAAGSPGWEERDNNDLDQIWTLATGSTDGTFTLYNAWNEKYITAYNSMTTTATDATFESKGHGQFTIKLSGGSNILQANLHGWSVSNSNLVEWGVESSTGYDDPATWYIEAVTAADEVTLGKVQLKSALDSHPQGTNPGFYDQTAQQAVYDNTSATIAQVRAAYDAAESATVIKPVSNKYYTIKNVYSEKYMADNGGSSVVSTLHPGTPEIWQFEEITTGDYKGSYYIKNQSTSKYLSTIGWQGTLTTVASDASNKGAYDLFSGKYVVKPGAVSLVNWKSGTGSGDMGTINYSSDTKFDSWNGNDEGKNNFYIAEIELPSSVNITYQIKDGENVIWTQTTSAAIGGNYPAVTGNIVNNFITISGIPTDAVPNTDQIVVLTYTTKAKCFSSVSAVDTWYALDIHGNENKYPVYNNGGAVAVEYTANVDAPTYWEGYTKSDNYAWAFIGNPITGLKLYNKGAQKYLYQQYDERADNDSKDCTFDGTGSTFIIMPMTSNDNGSNFALKQSSFTNYLNHRKTGISCYDKADGGSGFRVWALNTTDASLDVTVGSSSYTKYSKYFNTLVVPFYSAIPEGVNVYKVTADADGALTLEEQTDWVKPFTAYLIKGSNNTKYTFTNTTAGTSTDEVETGNLHGVLATDGKSLSSGYVLATSKSAQTQAFMQLGTTITLGKNKCYLTLPTEAEARGITTVYLPGMDTPTAISEVFGGESTLCDGKYIQDGKVVIVKNNAKFNVTGQKID